MPLSPSAGRPGSHRRQQGIGVIEQIFFLRQLFGLSLPEAKEVRIVADGLTNSLSEYQERYILPGLEEALRELEDDEDG